MVCDIYNKSGWAKAQYLCGWGTDVVMFMYAHEYDVALCGDTIRNVALGLWVVGWPPLAYTNSILPAALLSWI